MSGARGAFTDLDTGICGMVRFGDGSVVRIEGCGTVVFRCKSREYRVFTSIYFIPKLKTNILSIGQFDELGYDTRIKDGVMTIRDVESRLLANITRAMNRLYVLYATIAQLICLLARGEDLAHTAGTPRVLGAQEDAMPRLGARDAQSGSALRWVPRQAPSHSLSSEGRAPV
jgi:hypothetical protein